MLSISDGLSRARSDWSKAIPQASIISVFVHPISVPSSLPEPGQKTRISGPAGAMDALFLSRLASQGKPLLILCATAWDAQRLVDEINWFNPELKPALFPDWETLPYDAFSPHPDLISDRLATLYRLSRGEFRVVAVPLTPALTRLPPAEFLAHPPFFLKQG